MLPTETGSKYIYVTYRNWQQIYLCYLLKLTVDIFMLPTETDSRYLLLPTQLAIDNIILPTETDRK